MEDLLGSLLLTTVSQNGPKISQRGVVRFTSQFFVLDKLKSIPIRIGGQKAWEEVRNDFIGNKEKIASKDYELHGRCKFSENGLKW